MISVLSFSEAGGHPTNEDAFAIECHPDDSDGRLCFLADGQGGRAGGARAARLACRTAIEVALGQPRGKLAAPSAWVALLRRADEAVCADREAGLTTLLGLGVAGDRLVGASCGDSSVLAMSAGATFREVTASQAKNPPVGSGMASFTSFALALATPWAVVAMSDGVWKYVGWERVVAATKAECGQALLNHLQGYARLRTSRQFPDDFTVILFERRD
jgi:hypothetical protein